MSKEEKSDKPWQDKEWLIEQYHGKSQSLQEVADVADCSLSTISKWMKKFDVERRSRSVTQAEGDIEKLQDEEWMREEYCNKQNGVSTIAEKTQMAPSAVNNWLDKHDIEKRHSTSLNADANLDALRNEKKLRKMYFEDGFTLHEIANELSVSYTTVTQWFQKHGIDRREPGQRADMNIEKLNDREFLQERYVQDEWTISEIADECNCSNWAVRERLIEFGVNIRRTGWQIAGDREKLHDSEYLNRRYWEDDLSMAEVAGEIGCSQTAVRDSLIKYGIGTKSISHGLSNGDLDKITKAKLEELYVDEKKKISEIAEKFGLSYTAIYRRLLDYGIEIRPRYLAQSNGDIKQLDDEDWLRKQYVEKERSTVDIANELGLHDETVRARLIEYDIPRRDRKEAIPSGSDHPSHKEGNISEYGPNWDEQRLKARIRDQAKCQVCGKPDHVHIKEFGRVNHVHHIQPRSDFVDSDGNFDYISANRLGNLITVCTTHHPQIEDIPIDNRHRSTDIIL